MDSQSTSLKEFVKGKSQRTMKSVMDPKKFLGLSGTYHNLLKEYHPTYWWK